jgi:hypothetical protein
MKGKRFWMMALVLALVLALLPGGHTARADDPYRVTNTYDSGPGSLRQAIIDANTNDGPDTIKFRISVISYCYANGVCVIRPTSPLPALTDDWTTIDGYTQFLAAEATDTTLAALKIVIDGSSAGDGADGLAVNSANNVIKGLVINRFSRYGVIIFGNGATGNTVSGNYIGTHASGTVDLGNTSDGVLICNGAQNNTIGGDEPAERNVISGNDFSGVSIYGSGARDNTVSGNYIGTDANGTTDLGNYHGVWIGNGAQNNTIGGDADDERNVISGNDTWGVSISGSDTTGNTVSGNYIGTDASGTADLGNGWDGVRIARGAQNNTVGPDNLIAHNGDDGVEVDGSSTTGNTITQNSIFSNSQGIDLVDGANGNIAAPVIVATTSGSVNIIGTACSFCIVELFENNDTDGEGETFVGAITAGDTGNFVVTVDYLSKPYLTATATDSYFGRTSEFSEVFTATVTGGGSVYLPIILKNTP